MPLAGWDRNVDPVATLPDDNVERAAGAVDGLVEHDVVLDLALLHLMLAADSIRALTYQGTAVVVGHAATAGAATSVNS